MLWSIPEHARPNGVILPDFKFDHEEVVWNGASPLLALEYRDALPETQRVRLDRMITDYRKSRAKDTYFIPPQRSVGDQYLPFQRAGIQFASDRPNSMIGDQPGLGKSIQAIGVANTCYHDRILIVCPASLKYMWASYVKRWYCGDLNIYVMEGTQDTIPKDSNIIIVNYDVIHRPYIRAQLERSRFDGIIYDEFHALINPLSLRGEMVRNSFPRMVKNPDNNGSHVFLSATPITSRPIQLWNILAAFSPETIHPYSSYYDYATQFCEGRNMYKDTWYVNGSCNQDELNFRLRSGFMVRREKAEVLTQLPAKRPPEIVPLSIGEDSEVTRLQNEVLSLDGLPDTTLGSYGIRAGGYTEMSKQQVMAALARLRAHIGRVKLAHTIDILKEQLQNNAEKIIVFVIHKETARGIATALAEYDPIVITGDTLTRKRFDMAEAFQTDEKHRLVIGNITAAGVGLTLTAAKKAFFAELPWTKAEFEQAEDRIHRIGQTEQIGSYLIVLRGSLEEYILRGLLNQERVLNHVLDRDILPDFGL